MAGVIGTWGHERGLTFYEVDLGGHELPRLACTPSEDTLKHRIELTATRYAPGPSFRAMELLLGRISSLGDVGDFTPQSTTITDMDTGDLKV
jgi:carboxypeptidase D